MRVQTSWRELLGIITHDMLERQRIANELGVSQITLMRWVNNESKPRLQYLRQLIQALPQYRFLLTELIAIEFPEFLPAVKEEIVEDLSQEIPSEFYGRVLIAYLTTPKSQRFWSISNLILQQSLGQLDPDHRGMAITVVTCMPPSGQPKVQSLRERVGKGTSPWPLNLEQQAIFLGAESLAGYAVTSCRPIVIQSSSESGVFPAHWVELEQSAAAYPILRLNASAGCLLASSMQRDYFLPSRRELLQNYANLMVLAFEPEEFYEISDIDLQPMPFYLMQEQYLSAFQKRVSVVMREATMKQQPINILEAEQLVWKQLEEELLRLPPYMGNKENQDNKGSFFYGDDI